ncbi:hypothetical protein BC834DRAFT_655495 [Gloeopeniophorella convolvens]|nr:hypothetical protein BC834DRAFT_655495 [Gloeopeniophorella convolvens]
MAGRESAYCGGAAYECICGESSKFEDSSARALASPGKTAGKEPERTGRQLRHGQLKALRQHTSQPAPDRPKRLFGVGHCAGKQLLHAQEASTRMLVWRPSLCESHTNLVFSGLHAYICSHDRWVASGGATNPYSSTAGSCLAKANWTYRRFGFGCQICRSVNYACQTLSNTSIRCWHARANVDSYYALTRTARRGARSSIIVSSGVQVMQNMSPRHAIPLRDMSISSYHHRA